MKLRERTGAGMMECKKFLVATEGDIEKAIVEMRKAGQAKADKKADRVAAEGIIIIVRSADNKRAYMLEVNSETDFVARDSNFMSFTEQAAQAAMNANITDVETLASTNMPGTEQTVEQARQELIAKIGENIKLRRLEVLTTDGVIGAYTHSNRIGVFVAMEGGDESLAKDIAMHIAASKPTVVSREDVSEASIANEREIFLAQAKDSNKPQEIIEKMVDGRISKFLDEVSLSGQAFIKDPSMKVGKLLEQKQAKVTAFQRFEVGEGIEKKEDNFVEEVMAQVRDN